MPSGLISALAESHESFEHLYEVPAIETVADTADEIRRKQADVRLLA